MIFKAADIQWVKNVKYSMPGHLTYMEEFPNDYFPLHWSKTYIDGKEAEKAKMGDLILMFQRPNKVTYLTHLVTPINETFIDCKRTNPDYPWGRLVAIIARAKNGIPAPTGLNFTPVNRTHCYSIDNIRMKQPGMNIRTLIWDAFLPYMLPVEGLPRIITLPDASPELSGLEGVERIYLGMHKYRERNTLLAIEKKKIAASQNNLNCECCNFNFALVYPEHGEGFIECHHTVPIHQGERITKLKDLALVCSNCHRMLHRKNKDGAYYTTSELSNIVRK